MLTDILTEMIGWALDMLRVTPGAIAILVMVILLAVVITDLSHAFRRKRRW